MPVSSNGAKQRRAEARPDEILDAALDAFQARGFDAATMDEIAAAAGLSKAGVYLYFGSKDAILAALIRRHVAPVAAAAGAMAEAGEADPVATLRAVLRMVALRMRDPRTFAVPRIVVSVAARFPELAETYRREVVDPGRRAVARLIAAGVAQGRFRPVDPMVATRALVGPMIMEMLLLHVLRDPAAAPASFPDDQLEFTLAGLRPETGP